MSLLVKYMGTKDWCKDRLFKTGGIWYGQGDVQEIENEEAARKLCDFAKDVFKIVKPGEVEKIEKVKEVIEENDSPLDRIKVREEDGSFVTLRNASYQAAYRHVEEHLSVAIPEGATKQELLNQVEQVEKLRDELVRTPAADATIEMREGVQVSRTPTKAAKPAKAPAKKVEKKRPPPTLEAKGLALLGDL